MSFILLGVIIMYALFSAIYCAFADDTAILTIAYEASGESLEAQILVARCIITRSKQRKMSYEAVCKQKWQFSCWNKGAKLKPRTKAELERARQAWQEALKRKEVITHYHDTSVKPYWIKSMKFVCRIGKLLFYKERK